jgi:hypothetical protein
VFEAAFALFFTVFTFNSLFQRFGRQSVGGNSRGRKEAGHVLRLEVGNRKDVLGHGRYDASGGGSPSVAFEMPVVDQLRRSGGEDKDTSDT